MIFGVMSDTHGNVNLMHRAADWMTDVAHGERIYHLGDDYEDAELLAAAGLPVRMVPGLWCAAYRSSKVPNTLVETVDGLTLACAHADQDLGPREREARLVMTGHTHVAIMVDRGKNVFLNPGHLKSFRDREQTPSFAIVETEPNTFRIRIHELSGALRRELSFPRAPQSQPGTAPT